MFDLPTNGDDHDVDGGGGDVGLNDRRTDGYKGIGKNISVATSPYTYYICSG